MKHTHHYVRAIYNCKIRLREGIVTYEKLSIEGVRRTVARKFAIGVLQFCGGAFRLSGGIDIMKLTKTPLI